ncbi:retrotransposon-like family member retr-1 [Labeo rohita]|uniref:Retrotransposon-like family member retr-1 n=1 Tax=Labeo rohita TaxID=84645 RepID=A0A498P2P2_LABRO|nr:retrotransposon-like family member retr-1 [Labeo rohita]
MGFQTHCTTSPRYPQSNGLAEKTVKTAKHILGKARADDKDYCLGLLEYQKTPVDNLKSPAQLLMSRRLRSNPMTAARLQPHVTPQHVFRNQRGACQYRQQLYYNRPVKALPPLAAGTHIRFHHEDGSWQPAKIIQPVNTHRSYHIQTEEGQMLRSNR